jgi:hypothetical protein
MTEEEHPTKDAGPDDFPRTIHVDRETWEHFGSEERILETLRLLVDIAKKNAP